MFTVAFALGARRHGNLPPYQHTLPSDPYCVTWLSGEKSRWQVTLNLTNDSTLYSAELHLSLYVVVNQKHVEHVTVVQRPQQRPLCFKDQRFRLQGKIALHNKLQQEGPQVAVEWGNNCRVGHSYLVHSIWHNNLRVNMLFLVF